MDFEAYSKPAFWPGLIIGTVLSIWIGKKWNPILWLGCIVFSYYFWYWTTVFGIGLFLFSGHKRIRSKYYDE